MHDALEIQSELELPFGLVDGRGFRHRRARIRALSGRAEWIASDELNPFIAASKLLAGALNLLGPLSGSQIDPTAVGTLLPVDRDWLLLQVNIHTFGGDRVQMVRCPADDCQHKMDVKFDLRDANPPTPPPALRGEINHAKLGRLAFRLPTVSDQILLWNVPLEEAPSLLLSRCLADPPFHLLSEPGSAVDREQILAEILATSSSLDLSLDLNCNSCKFPFRFRYDVVTSLIAELKVSRRSLLKEVHYLAFYYHWSQDEILNLPRSLRREYLELIDAEVSRSSGEALL